jgi:hypothetical protein
MSGDIEDFLRRAAQRRQAKAVEQKEAQTPQRRVRREYTDARSERITRSPYEMDPSDEIEDIRGDGSGDEILTAEIVDVDEVSHSRQIQQMEDQRRSIEEAKKVARRLEEETAKKKQKTDKRDASRSAAIQSTGDPVADLLANFRRPGTIQQAILLREIIDRPDHRW